MKAIETSDIQRRIRLENPWWTSESRISTRMQAWKPRAYFDLFYPLVADLAVRRAVVLMGPRRVGKTVMIHHAIQQLIEQGVPANSICYLSVDHPIYNGLTLEQLLEHYFNCHEAIGPNDELFVFFDEIQYLRKWEEHLKSFVDLRPNIKCVVSGSAAAALRLKSTESGAGRFTDFLLPPLTFYEYLDLLGITDLVRIEGSGEGNAARVDFQPTDIEALNEQFLGYVNFGGYPEVVLTPAIQADPARFVKSDIIDKVLLRDLPSLYGIQDVQELNHLFTTLAYNTASELSLNELSQNSGVAKNTIKRYIEYLEAAFLVKLVHRVDHNARRFDRANYFKVYLTNPSMRAALFSPVGADDPAVPYLTETAIYSQWFHSEQKAPHYARWADGEVDIVMLGSKQEAIWAVEVKWSDRYCDSPGELSSLLKFSRQNKLSRVKVTSKTRSCTRRVDGVEFDFQPASLYCYIVGYNIVRNKRVVSELEASALG